MKKQAENKTNEKAECKRSVATEIKRARSNMALAQKCLREDKPLAAIANLNIARQCLLWAKQEIASIHGLRIVNGKYTK